MGGSTHTSPIVSSWLRVLKNSDLGEISGVRCY
jgi:hypothetical protein